MSALFPHANPYGTPVEEGTMYHMPFEGQVAVAPQSQRARLLNREQLDGLQRAIRCDAIDVPGKSLNPNVVP